jgi:hypothetical protein
MQDEYGIDGMVGGWVGGYVLHINQLLIYYTKHVNIQMTYLKYRLVTQ